MKDERVEVLLVEDNAADAELARHVLHCVSKSSRIHVVRDGEAALDFLFCRGPFGGRDPGLPPRLILLDLNLPKLDGLDVLREAKRHPQSRAIPVVILTSSREERDLIDGYALGVNSYIRKPADCQQFRNVVKEAGAYWLGMNEAPPPNGI